MTGNIGVIVARMGSTRLPGKAGLEIGGRTVLERIIRSLKHSLFLDEIVLATTRLPEDDTLAFHADRCGIQVYRGSDVDVLDRVVSAIAPLKGEGVVVAYGDNPLTSAEIVDLLVSFRERENLDYAFMPGLPIGADIGCFSRAALEVADAEARLEIEREHLNAYIVERSAEFRVGRLAPPVALNRPNLRLTLDTKKDLDLMHDVELRLDRMNRPFALNDVVDLANDVPELFLMNAEVEQRYATETWRRQRSGDRVC